MTKEFCSYEQSLALKKLGFDEPCLSYYEGESFSYHLATIEHSGKDDYILPAPLYQQAFRFFREKYNLRGFIGFRPNVKQFDYHVYDMSLSGMEYVKQRTMEKYNKDPLVGTYEEAESACLDKLIEIVKNK